MSTHPRVLKGSTRWHRIVDGVIKRVTVKPGEQPPAGYLPGMGPIHDEELRINTSIRFRGIPKTTPQRERMRHAKLGVPKSPEHRKAMSEAHKRRHVLVHQIMKELGVSWNMACHILRERQSNK